MFRKSMKGIFLMSLIVFITGCPSSEDMNVFGNAIVDASPTPTPVPTPTATPTPTPPPPDKVAIIAGNNQTGAVNSTLASTFIVQVTDTSIQFPMLP